MVFKDLQSLKIWCNLFRQSFQILPCQNSTTSSSIMEMATCLCDIVPLVKKMVGFKKVLVHILKIIWTQALMTLIFRDLGLFKNEQPFFQIFKKNFISFKASKYTFRYKMKAYGPKIHKIPKTQFSKNGLRPL